jgi:hypothetical protein
MGLAQTKSAKIQADALKQQQGSGIGSILGGIGSIAASFIPMPGAKTAGSMVGRAVSRIS